MSQLLPQDASFGSLTTGTIQHFIRLRRNPYLEGRDVPVPFFAHSHRFCRFDSASGWRSVVRIAPHRVTDCLSRQYPYGP